MRFQQEQLVQSHSLPHPTMANRQGYDVVVDVDAEVCKSCHRSRTSLKKPNTNTETGRPWPYRPPRRQPRVPQLQYALLLSHKDYNTLTLSSLQHSPTPPPAPPKSNPTQAPSSAPQAPANPPPPPSASSGASPSTSSSSTSTPPRFSPAAAPPCTRARTSSTSSRATRTSTGRSGSRPPSLSSCS